MPLIVINADAVGRTLGELDIPRRFGVEVILTGRYAPAEILAKADLVTEMREVKHYIAQGVLARDGIER